MKEQILKTKQVIFDEEVYPRNKFNWLVAHNYANAMQSGSVFPPIIVASYERKFILVDGKHRLEAHKNNKEEHISAEVLKGLNYDEIYVEAVKRNTEHGYQLSPQEKRKIVVRLQDLHYEPAQISEITKVPMEKLERFVGQTLINSLTGKVVVKAPLKHLAGTTVQFDVENMQEPLNTRSQLEMINNLIILIENNVIDVSNVEIVKRLEVLKSLLQGAVG